LHVHLYIEVEHCACTRSLVWTYIVAPGTLTACKDDFAHLV